MTDDKKDPQTATSEQGNDLELTITTKEGLVIDAPGQHGGELKRNLAQRHLLMLAIGGVIGPGYFVGMGNGLSSAGPAGLLICFGVVGTLLYAVMQSLGELGAFIPVAGSFTHYTYRFIDPCWAFALGWNYWLLWAGIIMAEYNNLGLVLTFWDTAMPRWGWIMVFWVIFMAFTFLGVKSFGEAEFWLASIKVLFILIFFICAILISTGVIGGEKIGFKFYRDPGPFADGVKGVFKIFVFAALQYSGTEMVGLTAGESANPSKDVPKAVKSVVWRIVVIFLGGIFFLTITVPFNDPNLLNAANKTARSPFVIAFTRVGVTAGAHAVNAVIVITILSAVNAALYVGSRTLYGLAVEKQAPKIFAMTNSRGVPVYAYVFMNTVGFLSLLNLASGAGQFYTWVVSMTGVATFITWGCICLCHIRMRQALSKQGISTDVLPFCAPGYPYVPWAGFITCVGFVFLQGWTAFAPWDLQAFFMNYIVIVLFLVLGVGWKVVYRTEWVQPGRANLEDCRRGMVVHGHGV